MRSIPIATQHNPAAETEADIDLQQLLGAFSRGKWRIFICTMIAAAIGIYYALYMTTPLYTATATVALQSRNGQVVDLASPTAALDGGDWFTINTEVETLQSRDLIGKLVDELEMVGDPDFNYALRPPEEPPLIPVRQMIGKALALVSPSQEGADAAAPAPTEEETREIVINAVMGLISVSNISESYVFEITVTTDRPGAAQKAANGLADVYIDDQIDQKYKATERATDWLSTRVGDLKIELESAENAVKAFNASTDLVSAESLAALNRQLKDRRDRVDAARTQAAGLEARAGELTEALTGGDPARMSAVAQDPALRQLLTRLNQPGARKTFDDRFAQIAERARFEATRARAQAGTLQDSVTDLEAQVERQSAELLRLEQLEREAVASRQLYEYFLNRLKETSAQQGVHEPDSRILSHATMPTGPSSPRKKLIVVMAAFVGFIIGCALVLLREMRQTGFRSAPDLEAAMGVNVFAQIPKAPFSKRHRLMNYLAAKPSSMLAEAVRNLRTSVLLSNVDKPPQLIMITSSLPGEGKTTQSLALAQSFADMGKRVLLIEGDIRRRVFQQYFNLENRPGLISVVSGEATLDDAVVHSEAHGMDVLAGEKSSVNAADFFSSDRFRQFLDELRQLYDVILIDTPPVLVVPDARVIGQSVDASIYAVHWNKTTRTQIEEGLHSLQTVGVKVSGLTLTQINLREAQRYGGKYGELYSAYGKKYYNN